MPTISNFYGIIILMHFLDREHNPPHIHAVMAEREASFKISNGEIVNGVFPKRAHRLVKEFIKQNKNELMEMWETGNYHKLPPLE